MAHKRSRLSCIDKDDPQTSSENPPDSPLSGDDTCRAAATTASPSVNKKSRRGIQKRVVSVPIGELGGSRSSTISKGDAYPPSDSWAWRKYGQKPIKGSPYPRGYYRCSSSKGCPARKQVERSHADPTILVITYASDHNHPTPTSSKQHHQHHHRSNLNNSLSSSFPTTAAAAATDSSDAEAAAPTTPSTTNSAIIFVAGNDMPSDNNSEELFTDTIPDHFEMDGDTLLGAGTTIPTFAHFSWLSDVVSFDVPSLVGPPRCDDADVAMLPAVMREEDELLFADLGELPECSAVFRTEVVEEWKLIKV